MPRELTLEPLRRSQKVYLRGKGRFAAPRTPKASGGPPGALPGAWLRQTAPAAGPGGFPPQAPYPPGALPGAATAGTASPGSSGGPAGGASGGHARSFASGSSGRGALAPLAFITVVSGDVPSLLYTDNVLTLHR